MKTEDKQNAIRERDEAVNRSCHDLTEEELTRVSGGSIEDAMKRLMDGMKIFNSCEGENDYQINEKTRERLRQGIDPYRKEER